MRPVHQTLGTPNWLFAIGVTNYRATILAKISYANRAKHPPLQYYNIIVGIPPWVDSTVIIRHDWLCYAIL